MTVISEESYNAMSVSTRFLLQEAEKRGLDIRLISAEKNTFILTWKGKEHVFKATAFDNSTSMTRVCSDKYLTATLLEHWGWKIPRHQLFDVSEMDKAVTWAAELKDFVVKPLDAGHGNGITVLPTMSEFPMAWESAKQFVGQGSRILVEEFIAGEDYRFVFVGETCIYVVHRIPAHVIGDGKATVEELVTKENAQSYRGQTKYSGIYCPIEINTEMIRTLDHQGISLTTVPAAGQKIVLRLVCNIGQGGTGEYATEKVHPDLMESMRAHVRKLNMRIVAVDVRCCPIEEVRSFHELTVLELNACPGVMVESTSKSLQDNTKKIWDAVLQDL